MHTDKYFMLYHNQFEISIGFYLHNDYMSVVYENRMSGRRHKYKYDYGMLDFEKIANKINKKIELEKFKMRKMTKESFIKCSILTTITIIISVIYVILMKMWIKILELNS